MYKLKDSEPMKSWADYAASFLFSPSTKGARTELVDLLAVQRVADLNVRSRVVLLDALQQMPLSACPRRGELWVRNVMLWTRGDELTELKTLCDLKGDVHSCGLGVPSCGGAFTPSTRVVSRNDGSGWSLFRF